ncbi:MAG: NAD(P)H-hydrate dehydratase [Nitrososphaeria archaeon]
MRTVVIGTVPIKSFLYAFETPSFDGRDLILSSGRIPCAMGTTATYTATMVTMKELRCKEKPLLMTAGDIGKADGSIVLYENLIENFDKLGADILVLHYIMPIITLMKKFADKIRRSSRKPILIADAGALYAVKAANLGSLFDVLTPDPGEMAFLADPEAIHPTYIEKHLFEIDTVDVPKLIKQAYELVSMPNTLIVKGRKDYIVDQGKIVKVIEEPFVPTLEPIGGTGDTLTGIIAGLIAGGMTTLDAVINAAKINRVAGLLANPTPRTRVYDIIDKIPAAIHKVLDYKNNVNNAPTEHFGPRV